MPRVRPPEAGNPPGTASTSDHQVLAEAQARGTIAVSVSPSFAEPKSLPQTPPDLAPLWSRVIRAENLPPLLRAVLINSTLESLDSKRATLICSPRYAKDAHTKWRASITDLLTKESGTAIEVIIRSTEGDVITAPAPLTSSPISASATQPAPSPAPTRQTPAAPSPPNTAADHPLVKQAIELFGGRIVDIQPRRRP